MKRWRLIKKVIIKSRKIPYADFKLLGGKFPSIPGYVLYTNSDPDKLVKYGHMDKRYKIKKGFKVINYAKSRTGKHLPWLVGVYRLQRENEHDKTLEDHLEEVRMNKLEHAWEMKMMYDAFILEPKPRIITTNA